MVALSVPVYGGATHDYFPDSTCPRCEASIDRHRIHSIFSSEHTTNLACKFQGLLDKVNITAILHGYVLPRTSTMVGAAHASFGNSSSCDYVTVSGDGDALCAAIDQGKLGRKVVIVTTPAFLCGINGKIFRPPPLTVKPYPVGSCAAQKLLTQIFMDAKGKGGVTAIEMSEIMWRSSQVARVRMETRQWRTGTVVPSCETCMQILPLMLCDKADD